MDFISKIRAASYIRHLIFLLKWKGHDSKSGWIESDAHLGPAWSSQPPLEIAAPNPPLPRLLHLYFVPRRCACSRLAPPLLRPSTPHLLWPCPTYSRPLPPLHACAMVVVALARVGVAAIVRVQEAAPMPVCVGGERVSVGFRVRREIPFFHWARFHLVRAIWSDGCVPHLW